jgi:hypothetical protein
MTTEDVPAKLTLRVLEEHDDRFQTYVARCLETGTIVTGDSMEEAHDLLMETLQMEVIQAGRARRAYALFEKPAGPRYELRWQVLAAEQAPYEDTVTVFDAPLGARKGVRSEISILGVKRAAAVAG